MNNTDRNIFAPKDPTAQREDQAAVAAAWALAIINLTGVHGIGPLCADDWAMFDAEAQSLRGWVEDLRDRCGLGGPELDVFARAIEDFIRTRASRNNLFSHECEVGELADPHAVPQGTD